MTWQRSSFCADSTCIEVMRVGDVIMVRDSKDLDRAPLEFDHQEWTDFLAAVRAGEFDA